MIAGNIMPSTMRLTVNFHKVRLETGVVEKKSLKMKSKKKTKFSSLFFSKCKFNWDGARRCHVKPIDTKRYTRATKGATPIFLRFLLESVVEFFFVVLGIYVTSQFDCAETRLDYTIYRRRENESPLSYPYPHTKKDKEKKNWKSIVQIWINQRACKTYISCWCVAAALAGYWVTYPIGACRHPQWSNMCPA
jgi:hypothetical protein